ncbi:hypothetical protein GCM10009587_35180 [Microbacterium maritypicum]
MRYDNPDALTFASHDQMSVARKGDRLIRGKHPVTQPVNAFLDAMRIDWADHSVTERADYVRRELAILRDPLGLLDEDDHVTFAELTLGELYHARIVLTRLLPFMVEAASAVSAGGPAPDEERSDADQPP